MFSYSSLYKPVKSILSSGFDPEKSSLGVNTKVNDDLALGIKSSRNNNSGGVESSLAWNQKFQDGFANYEMNGSLDQEGTVSLSLNASGLAKGLVASVATDLKTNNEDNKVETTLDYTHDKFHYTSNYEFGSGKKLTVTKSGVAQIVDGFVAGGEVKLNAYPLPKDKTQILNEYNFGARYSMSNLHIAALFEKSMRTVKIGYAQQIDPNVTVATEFAQDLQSETGTKPKPVFTVGSSYKIDNDSSVRAKMNSNGIVNATYSLRINERLAANISAQANAFALNNGTSNVGFSVNYNA